jgi:hypothetical protein
MFGQQFRVAVLPGTAHNTNDFHLRLLALSSPVNHQIGGPQRTIARTFALAFALTF